MSLKKISLMLLLLCSSIESAADDLFRVDNIHVSARTGDQADSKSIAFINGAKIALHRLISRLNASPGNNMDNMECINSANTLILVKSYEIRSERLTTTSYSADIDFVFNKQDVESLINKCGLEYGSSGLGSVLFIPLLKTKSGYRIIDTEFDQEIISAISSLPHSVGSLIIEPMYDKNLSTIENLNLELLTSGNYQDALKILEQYGKKNLLTIAFEFGGRPYFKIRLITQNEEYKDTKQYNPLLNESKKRFLTRILNTILKDLDLNWKKGFSNISGRLYNSGVLVELSDPLDWKKFQNILSQIESIKQYKFKSIGHNSVEIDLKYTASPEELSQSLKERNIAILREGNHTIMKFIK